MAHRTVKSGYRDFVQRLNRAPQGAPESRHLYRILQILMDEQEASLLAALPIKPFTASRAARIWKRSEAETRGLLEKLAGRALLVDVDHDGESVYALPPPMAGFFEFSLMRLRDDLDQKALAELFYRYLNEEEDFIKALFTEGETQLGRVYVNEQVLGSDQAAHVLDYERASGVIRTASHIGVGMCYCRHKMEHLGRVCDAPMDICMTFNGSAESLTRHGHARAIDAAECLDLLDEAVGHGLVQFGENVQRRVNFICNCCGCCCEALIAQRRFAHLHPIHTSNWIAQVDAEACNGCGRCVDACPVEALTLVSANDPHRPKRRTAQLAEDLCLGCGVCVPACPTDGLKLEARPERVITPVNGAHRYVLMAAERGKLQHLIFDNQVMASHRALAALLGAVLRLPPLKRALAGDQMKSRYLEAVQRHQARGTAAANGPAEGKPVR